MFDVNALSDEELQTLVLYFVRCYGLRVYSDFTDIKYLVDGFHHLQQQIEQALDALEHEDRE
jgi:hypothetical protein